MLIYNNIKPYKNTIFNSSVVLKNKKSVVLKKTGMILAFVLINDNPFYIFHQKIVLI